MSLLVQAARIGSRWVEATGDAVLEVIDPGNGERIGVVPDVGREGTERAIAAAAAALPAWRALTAKKRADLLIALHDAQLDNERELAELLVRENGKPLAEAIGEIRYGASFLRWFAEEARRIYGEVVPSPWPDKRILVTREPVGVAAAITPWNFPNAMLTRKLGPALAAGCTFVAKPAEATPLSALAIAKLAEEVGIPDGVLNIVTGSPAPIGEVLCESPTVRKLSFTGSTRVGRLLLRQCADTLKRVSLELGGNAPFLVFEDADLDAAVEGAMASKFRNAGQTCVASNRFLVHHSVAEDFGRRMAERVGALKMGHGLEEGAQVGPMITADAKDRVMGLLENARARGATALNPFAPAPGQFLQPIVLTGLTEEMDLWSNEIFGPVVPVRTFETDEEALALANDTPYGLAAYFYTTSLFRAFRISEGLEYGMVGVNTGMMSTTEAPFGGVKASGLGREGSHHGIEEYTELKYTCMDLG